MSLPLYGLSDGWLALQDRPPGVEEVTGWGLEVRGLHWHADTAKEPLPLHRLQGRARTRNVLSHHTSMTNLEKKKRGSTWTNTWTKVGGSSSDIWAMGMSSRSQGGFFLCRLLVLSRSGSAMFSVPPQACQLHRQRGRRCGYWNDSHRIMEKLKQLPLKYTINFEGSVCCCKHGVHNDIVVQSCFTRGCWDPAFDSSTGTCIFLLIK